MDSIFLAYCTTTVVHIILGNTIICFRNIKHSLTKSALWIQNCQNLKLSFFQYRVLALFTPIISEQHYNNVAKYLVNL